MNDISRFLADDTFEDALELCTKRFSFNDMFNCIKDLVEKANGDIFYFDHEEAVREYDRKHGND
ncbi:unnamed protein product [Hymenolepis diminuta]|uniref:Uncharacterized protein n=1 Tax=Hymenolepis diminuta TaxID=6216 RepID=A0A564Y8V5_HYMDI|nr:unnamed protein product [Hymenolepis diminuta]